MSARIAALVLMPLLVIGLSSCAGLDQMGSPAHRMSEWVSGTGFGAAIGTLIADNQRIPKEVPNGTGAVHAGCGALEDDTEMANGELPSPDPDVTTWLSEAYGLEGSAGTNCYNAGATNPKLLAKAYGEMTKAQGLFSRVLIRIQAIDNKVVSTTTTTDNGTGGIFG
jgi:hypothetical protein